jgi:hypothetical protein
VTKQHRKEMHMRMEENMLIVAVEGKLIASAEDGREPVEAVVEEL